MTATTLTIADFLLARLDEDEAIARTVKVDRDQDPNASDHGPTMWYADGNIGDPVVACEPARVLADVAAKRKIVDEHAMVAEFWYEPRCVTCLERHDGYAPDGHGGEVGVEHVEGKPWPCPTLRALASVHADHPDFDPAWR